MTTTITYLLSSLIVAIGFGANAYVQWKLGAQKAQSEATDNWKEAYESTNVRLKQIEEELKLVKLQYSAMEKENIGLTKEIQVLKQVQVAPSDKFELTVEKLLEEMKKSREDFLQLSGMWEKTNDTALLNNNMLKKLCKEE